MLLKKKKGILQETSTVEIGGVNNDITKARRFFNTFYEHAEHVILKFPSIILKKNRQVPGTCRTSILKFPSTILKVLI